MGSFFNTKFSLIQAPMAGVQTSDLVISVCEAGGLGSLPCAMLSLDTIRSEFEKIRRLTSKPFNANFFCHVETVFEKTVENRWMGELDRYYREFDIAPGDLTVSARRAPFNSEMAELVEQFRPEVVSFHFGLPDSSLLSRVKESGALVISSATSVEEAIWLEQHGADAIIAQGWEAGGHRGHFLSPRFTDQLGLMALLPQIVDSVSVPVIAAGAIADRRAVKAAFALGASAVQVGSAYLLSDEATTSVVHRRALSSPLPKSTTITNVFSGRPARGLVNRLINELGPISQEVPPFPHASSGLAPLRQAAEKVGRDDFSPLWAGQNTRDCKSASAAEITYLLMCD